MNPMQFEIRKLSALEILDSRGRPTVRATCELKNGMTAHAAVPSGASTGAAEAIELRDGDAARYNGLGCRRAVANIEGELNNLLSGKSWTQSTLDAAMMECDGTAQKSRLGANAILAVSVAFARAASLHNVQPLHAYFAGLVAGSGSTLPRPTINLWSGGKHAGGQVPIQDVLLVPTAAKTMDEALATAYAVYQAAIKLSQNKYGMRALTADEGGLAPPFPDAETMLADAVAAIEGAGFEPRRDVALAIDVAASHFFENDVYDLSGENFSGERMIARLEKWLEKFPIISIEDGLSENDWENWPRLKTAVAGRALTLGDDLLCTNPARIKRAIETGAADALLLKVNQIGTLSEAAQALQLARDANWKVVVSARSGETEDDWLADLAAGWNGDYIKIGSITQSERLAKYNRLLELEKREGLRFNVSA
jgi:enolase